MSGPEQATNGEEPRVVVRDRRRIDPLTGAVRNPDPKGPRHAAPDPAQSDPAQSGTAQSGTALPGTAQSGTAQPKPAAANQQAGAAGGAAVAADTPAGGSTDGELRTQLAERTTDLQRITAEYANYRRRVERDREAVVVAAKAAVVAELLPVLDDVERARAHGDLTGAFKAVADKLAATLEKAGLTPFGSEGDEFDPAVHQAVQHATSPDVPGPTVTAVLRRGYQLGERLLRTAMVGVTDHEPAAGTSPVGTSPAGTAEAETAETGSESTVADQEPPLQAGPAADHNPAQRDQG